jgi:dTMP kinase
MTGRPPGRLVSVEGIDGSGKSTVAARVAERLRSGGRDVLVLDRHAAAGTSGYTGSHLTALRRLMWEYPDSARTSELGFEHWAHLLAAWFCAVDHIVVRPALARGTCIVADSWVDKYVARFAVTTGLPAAQARFAAVTRPDPVVWLDASPQECAHRRVRPRTTEDGEWQDGSAGRSGFVAYQSGVREVYAALADMHGWFRVVPAEVATTVEEVVDRLATSCRGMQRQKARTAP